MVDQVNKGDDEIKNVASGNDLAGVSQKALEGFQAELSQERDKAYKGVLSTVMSAVTNSEAKMTENPRGTAVSGILQGLENSVPRSGKDGKPSSGLASLLGNAVTDTSLPKPNAMENSVHGISNLIDTSILNKPQRETGKSSEQNRPSDRAEMMQTLADLFNKPEGIRKLATGDYLVREDGKETIFTPNGDRVTVNADGSHVIKGDLKSVQTNKAGETTVTFADGSTVKIDKEGILEVARGKQAVSFPRFEKFRPHETPLPHPFPEKWPPRTPDWKDQLPNQIPPLNRLPERNPGASPEGGRVPKPVENLPERNSNGLPENGRTPLPVDKAPSRKQNGTQDNVRTHLLEEILKK